IMKYLGSFMIEEGVHVPTEEEDLEFSAGHIQPVILYVLRTIVKSHNWLSGLSSFFTQLLTAHGNDLNILWKILEIIYVLLNTEMKRTIPNYFKLTSVLDKPDISGLQNSLISIISKLPD